MASIDIATELLKKLNLGTVPAANTLEAKTWAGSAKSVGNRAFSKGDFKTAIAAFTGCIAADPTDKVFYSNRSAALASAERYDEAALDAQKAIDIDPTWSKGYSRLGLAWFKANKLCEAHSSYKAGLRVDPANKALLAGVEMVNAAMAAVEPVIGIDLGTTYSCAAVYQNGETVVLPNKFGENTTPSWVAFAEDGRRLIGSEAKRQAASNPTRTLFNIKRIIGREHGECHEEIKRMPFDVISGDGGKPVIELELNGAKKQYLPEQISAMVLESMKEAAEATLGRKITKAVVTVPAYFTDAQRRLTKDAGAIAGLDVLRIINEPTAAALAYGLDKKATRKVGDSGSLDASNVLVFDLGGGTFDVSLLKIDNGVFEVLSTSGDTHLGGEDFDSCLADWIQAEERKARGVDLFKDNDGALRKLRNACEKAKRELSISSSTEIELSVPTGEEDNAVVCRSITRQQFESLCEPIFNRCMDSVKRALLDAKCKVEDVDEVVLVGGSTRVPRVQQILREYFNGKRLCKTLHPDEAVAHGAAVQASILNGIRDASTDNLLLVDVIPMSLGIECQGKQFAVVVPRNTSIPCKKVHEFTTVEDYQTEVDVRVFEGERAITDGNHLLGSFMIRGIERAKKGVAKVEVAFFVNSNGLLTVSARDRVTGAKAHVEIDHDTGRLTPDEINALQMEALKFKEEDERAAALLEQEEELVNAEA